MSDLNQFRAETRAWLEANCPAEMRQPVRDDEDVVARAAGQRVVPEAAVEQVVPVVARQVRHRRTAVVGYLHVLGRGTVGSGSIEVSGEDGPR